MRRKWAKGPNVSDTAHMPFRLTRYTVVELLRVIGFAAVVLAAITAFGAIIKPLAGDSPISAMQALKYVGLSLVPMLQYALPFAAGFGATIVMHRLVSDNEIMAMSVSGLPYRVILAPVMVLACVLLLVMVLLVQFAIPRVYAVMGRVLAGDLTALLSYAVDNGRPVKFGDLEIYAEQMDVTLNPVDSEADERIELRRMVAARLGPNGAIESDVSASGAVLDLYEQEGIILIRMAMEDAVSWEAGAGSLRGFPRLEPTHAIPVPMPERTEPIAMSSSELRAVRVNPSRHPTIARRYQELADVLQQFHQREAMRTRLKKHGEVDLPTSDRSGHVWRVSAGGLSGGKLKRGPDQDVTVTEFDAQGEPLRIFRPEDATLSTEEGGLDGRDQRLVLEMYAVEVEDPPGADYPNRRREVKIANLDPFEVVDGMQPTDGVEILAAARSVMDQSRPVKNAVERIDRDAQKLTGQVTSRLWRRWAVALTAGLLPLLGAVLALNMRSAQPLTVYVIAFVPALLNLVLIAGGTSFMRQGSEIGGLALMWSGNFLLLGLIAIAWHRMARH